jgi:phosphatidyl-myo-inositol dimannoside synthase
MHVLVLTEHFLPSVGGSINWLVNTYSRYRPNEVVFVASQHEGDQLVDHTLPFRVERIPMTMQDWDPTVPTSLRRYLQISRYVHRSCRKHGIRQIHCAKVLPEGLIAWWLRFFDSIPYLLYAHGEEILIALSSRKFRWLLPKIYNSASAIIANSRNTKALLQGLSISPHKIHIIHPGVDIRSFNVGPVANDKIRQRFNLGQSSVLLTVGRLQQRKGQDMVIKALPSIQREIPNVKYVIVGIGEELANLKRLAFDVGVPDKVIFTECVSNEELASYYAACDVFIMPNRQIGADIEGFGMVYLEAGAAGKPVIGGRSGGTDDAIIEGLTGLRVDGNSVADIATAVISLLSDPKKAKAMGENGRLRVENEFTWEAVALRTSLVSATLTTATQRI